MIVWTHLVVSLSILVVAIVLVLPAETCVEGELAELESIVDEKRPNSCFLMYAVVSRKAALGEVARAVNCGCLLTEGQIPFWNRSSDNQLFCQ